MHKFYFAILLIASTLSASSDLPSCSDIDAYTTQCDPYTTQFLTPTNIAQSHTQTIHNRVITKKIVTSIEQRKIIKTISLNNLIDKYINKQEELYQKKEENATIERAGEVPPATEVNESGDEYIVFEVPPTHNDSQKESESQKEDTDFEVAIGSKPEATEQIKPKHSEPISQPMANDANISNKQKNSIEADTTKDQIAKKQAEQTVEPKYASYTVVKGDHFSKIAKRFGVSTSKLMQINNFDRDKILKIGEKILIPIEDQDYVDAIVNYSYVVKSGDSLIKISRRFGADLGDLKKYNNLKKRSLIRVGEKLILPIGDKLKELKAKEELAKKIALEKKKKALALKKKRERERLAKLALKKKKREEFLRVSKGMKHSISVIATAYSSTHSQTDSTPFLAAWNNRIRPGMKIIAVSWDLIRKYGITNGTKVRISGLPGIYTVRDKMNKKWRRRIDIYMGVDHRRTNMWGKRRVTLYY